MFTTIVMHIISKVQSNMESSYEFLFCVLLKSILKRREILKKQLLENHNLILNSISKYKMRKRKCAVKVNLPMPIHFLNCFRPRFRGIYRFTRSDDFWENLQLPINEKLYFESFRMRKETFGLLCQKLKKYLHRDTCFVQPPLCIEKQVAICLYKLASCAEYRCVGNVFGVHKSTVHKYFHAVIKAINELQKEFIVFPNLEAALEIAKNFERKSHIPNIIGAIDGTHIPIMPPKDGFLDYINRKGWASIVMQGVVDHKYMFADVAVKHPGSAHDALVFKESSLFKNSTQKIPYYNNDINGIATQLFLIGDPAYPLLPWLMKPYTGNLTPEEESFNVYLSSARMVVENAFGRLKGRWRCLCKRIDVDRNFVPNVVMACSILHNFVEQNKETYIESWTLQAREEETIFEQPNTLITSTFIIQNNSSHPKVVRDNLKEYLKNNFPMRTSNHL